jgi:hypothetical protein
MRANSTNGTFPHSQTPALGTRRNVNVAPFFGACGNGDETVANERPVFSKSRSFGPNFVEPERVVL